MSEDQRAYSARIETDRYDLVQAVTTATSDSINNAINENAIDANIKYTMPFRLSGRR